MFEDLDKLTSAAASETAAAKIPTAWEVRRRKPKWNFMFELL